MTPHYKCFAPGDPKLIQRAIIPQWFTRWTYTWSNPASIYPDNMSNKLHKQRLWDIKSPLMFSSNPLSDRVWNTYQEGEWRIAAVYWEARRGQGHSCDIPLLSLTIHIYGLCPPPDIWHRCSSFLTIEMSETMEVLLKSYFYMSFPFRCFSAILYYWILSVDKMAVKVY